MTKHRTRIETTPSPAGKKLKIDQTDEQNRRVWTLYEPPILAGDSRCRVEFPVPHVPERDRDRRLASSCWPDERESYGSPTPPHPPDQTKTNLTNGRVFLSFFRSFILSLFFLFFFYISSSRRTDSSNHTPTHRNPTPKQLGNLNCSTGNLLYLVAIPVDADRSLTTSNLRLSTSIPTPPPTQSFRLYVPAGITTPEITVVPQTPCPPVAATVTSPVIPPSPGSAQLEPSPTTSETSAASCVEAWKPTDGVWIFRAVFNLIPTHASKPTAFW